MRKPDFFIVGAPKCGTTALSRYLREHPNVFLSVPKEPHHFNTDHPRYRSFTTVEAYAALFEGATDEHTAVGEASTWYLYSHAAAAAIHAFDPNARMIVMLRDPVDLVHSLHSQMLHSFDEDEPDFETAWRLQDARAGGERIPDLCREPSMLQYREVGRLGEQVERLLEVMPTEQLHFVLFDDFVADTAAAYQTVLRFLGLTSDDRPTFERVNPNTRRRTGALSRLIERPPDALLRAGRVARRVLGVDLGRLWTIMRRSSRTISSRQVRRAPLDPELREQIAAGFRDDVRLLESLIDRDLSNWLR